LLFQGAAVDTGRAEREIRSAVASHPTLAGVLTVDPAAPWQRVVLFVELAQKLEVEAFSFTMKKDDAAENADGGAASMEAAFTEAS
jgi:biopolymer transport protein ExbD